VGRASGRDAATGRAVDLRDAAARSCAAQRRDGCAAGGASCLGARGKQSTADPGHWYPPELHGVSVYDGWAAYRTQTECRHALCNIHHLRELTFVEEQHRGFA